MKDTTRLTKLVVFVLFFFVLFYFTLLEYFLKNKIVNVEVRGLYIKLKVTPSEMS